MAGETQTGLRVLAVEPDASCRHLLEDSLKSMGYRVQVERKGRDGLHSFTKQGADLLMLSVHPPDMEGAALFARVREVDADVPVIAVAPITDLGAAVEAMERGAYSYVTKPLNLKEVVINIDRALERSRLIKESREYQEHLEKKVEERTAELSSSLKLLKEQAEELNESYVDTVYRLSLAAEYRDSDTASHLRRISEYTRIMGDTMALGADKVAVLRVASMMHDVGKIGIPDHILLKPGKFSAQEFDTMKKHTLIGKDILAGSSTDLLRVSETIALNHHERYDGQGYPKGLRGEEIPLASRIVTVADVYDAITSQRVYKPALGHEKACEVLRENAGGQFDPQVVEAFFDVMPEVRMLTEGENYSPGHEAGKRATTLLLVDREGSERDRVALFLSQQGHTVKTASAGKEALAAMAREGIHLVILNPHLPGMDGYEVLSVMKGVEEWKYTPVIVLSDPGYGDEIALGKELGADEHLFRPVNLMELHKKVKLLLRSRGPL